MREELYTPNDIVQKLGVSRSTVYKWFETGALKRVELPAMKSKRVRSEDLRKFLNNLGESQNEQKSLAKRNKRVMPFA